MEQESFRSETKKYWVSPLIYLILKLALILLVATTIVEWVFFFATKLIKSDLWNKMSDQWLNNCLITYIEKGVFDGVSNDEIMHYFQNLKNSLRIVVK